MAGSIGINTTNISQRSFETNMQHIGGQNQTTKTPANKTKAEETTVRPQTQSFDNVQLSSDTVEFAQDAAENASHVGVFQDQFDDDSGVDTDYGYAEAPGVVVGGEGEVPPEGAEPVEGETPDVGDGTVNEPVYPGDPDQGMSPYMPGSGDGNTPPPVDGGGEGPGGPDAPGDGEGAGEAKGPQQSQEERANEWKKIQDDMQAAGTVLAQMRADRQKWMVELWKIIQDTQTSIFSIIQETLNNRSAAFDRAHAGWSRVFNGR